MARRPGNLMVLKGMPQFVVRLAGVMLGLAAPAAMAQPSFELRVDADEVYVGESFEVELTIQGARQYSEPTFPNIPNCAVQPAGQSSSTMFVNGRMSQSVTISYRLTPRRAGELVVPPIEFEIDGRRVTTSRRSVRVLPASERSTVATSSSGDTLLLAEIKCRETHLVVGQQARFTLTFWVKAPTHLPTRLDANDIYGLMHNRRTGFGPFPEPRSAERVPLELDDGSKVSYFEFRTSADIRLEQEGPVTFEGLTIAMEYPQRLSRDVFGRPRLAEADTLAIRPQVVAPDVDPLPVEGRPAGFNGAVGRFELSVRPDATIVRVGDPISLTVEVTGDGPLEALAGPDLSAQSDLTSDFRVPEQTLTGRTVGGRRVFTQTIRAKRADVTEIPPIEFPYFDPQAREYQVARSNAVPIVVRASEVASADELLNLSTDKPVNERVAALQGLRGLKMSETDLLAVSRPITLGHVALSIGAPPAAFLGFWCWSLLVSRGEISARRRTKRAFSVATRRVRQAAAAQGGAAEIMAAFSTYLADRLGEPPGRFTGRSALDLLVERGVAEDTVALCRQLVERCESAAYGAAGADAQLAELAGACLTRLERERL